MWNKAFSSGMLSSADMTKMTMLASWLSRWRPSRCGRRGLVTSALLHPLFYFLFYPPLSPETNSSSSLRTQVVCSTLLLLLSLELSSTTVVRHTVFLSNCLLALRRRRTLTTSNFHLDLEQSPLISSGISAVMRI